MKNIFKKLIEKIKANPFKAQLLVVLIYPILPLALYASWVILLLLSKFGGAVTSFQSLFIALLGLVWFIGGPLGLIGGFLILLNKYSRKSVFFFVYGSISYLIIAGAIAFQGGLLLIVGANYWMGLHTLYLLFTFWVIGKQLFLIYRNRKNKVSI